MAYIPLGFLASFTLSSLLAFLFQGLKLDLSVAAAAAIGSVPGLAALIIAWRKDKRQQATTYADRVSELTVDERQQIREAAEQLRREEREHMERVVAGYVRAADTARARSHLMANGLMRYQLAHMELLQLCAKHDIDVPPKLLLSSAATELIAKLEDITLGETSQLTAVGESS